jgi:hypothetical protein
MDALWLSEWGTSRRAVKDKVRRRRKRVKCGAERKLGKVRRGANLVQSMNKRFLLDRRLFRSFTQQINFCHVSSSKQWSSFAWMTRRQSTSHFSCVQTAQFTTCDALLGCFMWYFLSIPWTTTFVSSRTCLKCHRPTQGACGQGKLFTNCMTEFSLLIKSLDFYVDPLEELEETISRRMISSFNAVALFMIGFEWLVWIWEAARPRTGAGQFENSPGHKTIAARRVRYYVYNISDQYRYNWDDNTTKNSDYYKWSSYSRHLPGSAIQNFWRRCQAVHRGELGRMEERLHCNVWHSTGDWRQTQRVLDVTPPWQCVGELRQIGEECKRTSNMALCLERFGTSLMYVFVFSFLLRLFIATSILLC